MNQYIITHEEEDEQFATGVMLGVFSAPNPESAMLELSKHVLDDRVQEEEFSTRSKVKMVEWVLGLVDSQEDIVIRPLGVDEYGDEVEFRIDDLQLDVD